MTLSAINMESILTYIFEKPSELSENDNAKPLDPLFKVKFLSAAVEKQSAHLMWLQIVNLVQQAKQTNEKLIILSRQWDVLQNLYPIDRLTEAINDALALQVKILISNTSSADATLLPLTPNLFWTDSVAGFDFLVIYESCFELILNEDFSEYNNIAECLENLTSNKMLIYPMINATTTANHQQVQTRMERLMKVCIELEQNKHKLLQGHLKP